MKSILIIIGVLLLTACQNSSVVMTLEEASPDQLISATKAGLTLELLQDTFQEFPLILETTLMNNSSKDFEFGDYYYLEVEKEGAWFILVHSEAVFIENPKLTDFGRVLPAGSQVQQDFSIDMLGLKLPPGQYRVVKTFLSNSLHFQEISLAVPFKVE